MSYLTFKEALAIMVAEDTQQDIDKLMADISMIDSQIAQRTAPLQQRKVALTKLLAQKQGQKQAEDKKNGANQQSGMQAQQQGQPSMTQTTTPGGTGSATPGGAPAMTR